MLRQTSINFEYKFAYEFITARPLLRGRAKAERTLGLRAVKLQLEKITRYRTYHKKFDQRARIRSSVDSAAVEHGTGWAHLRNDVARQNIAILPTTQRLLAQYEPLAFRSMLELCASSIPPPPSALDDKPIIPYDLMKKMKADENPTRESSPAADGELAEMVKGMLAADKNLIETTGATTSALRKLKISGQTAPTYNAGDELWLDAWKDFQTIDEKYRVKPQ